MTAQQIIGNPFANIGRISPDMEQRIGNHMAEAARREGNTATTAAYNYRTHAADQRREDRAEAVLAFLRGGTWETTRAIAEAACMSLNDARETGTRLCAANLVERRSTAGNGQFEFRLTQNKLRNA